MGVSDQEVLSEFYQTIWREEKGYVYLALKNPKTAEWKQRFFEWPKEAAIVVATTITERTSNEVYFAPSLFRERSSKKENVLGAFCFWIEFDGKLPVDFGEVPPPSMIVQTSTETHQHIYWCTDQLQEVDRIESVNHSLTYKLGADTSGWDANQVLRPPQTLNHKKQLTAKLVSKSGTYISSVAFSESIVINLPPKIELVGELPSLTDTVRKYPFDRAVWELFKNGNGQDRSIALMHLGYCLAEMNLMNTEIMTLLLDADTRWGKFSKRDDQVTRLTEIVTRARLKYPWRAIPDVLENQIITVGFATFLAQKIEIDWMWEGLLEKQGYLLLAGPTGVGKTLLSLDFAGHLALGKPFLGRSIDKARKVAIISLEMGPPQLQMFLSRQSSNYTDEEKYILERMLRVQAKGYPTYFNRPEEKMAIEELIQREEIECIIFDSLGSMTEQELTKETDVKNLMDWNDILRTKYGISTFIIHHPRKAQAGNKNPDTTADIYGSQYIAARASTILLLLRGRKDNYFGLKQAKLRLSALGEPIVLKRRDNLTYELVNEKLIDIIDEPVEVNLTEPTVEVTTEEFEF